jgi:hypothetical protein
MDQVAREMASFVGRSWAIAGVGEAREEAAIRPAPPASVVFTNSLRLGLFVMLPLSLFLPSPIRNGLRAAFGLISSTGHSGVVLVCVLSSLPPVDRNLLCL